MKLLVYLVIIFLFSPIAESIELPFYVLFDKLTGNWQTSIWGESNNGLQMRVSLNKEFDYNDQLSAIVEFQKDTSIIKDDINFIQNSQRWPALRFYFIHRESGGINNRYSANPFTFTNNIDSSQTQWSLLKNCIDTVLIEIPFKELRPGFYDGYAQYTVPLYDRAGWTGVLSSGWISFYVHEKYNNRDTILVTVPKGLKFVKGPQLAYDGSEVLVIDYEKGLYLGTRVNRNAGYSLSSRPMSETELNGFNIIYLLGDKDTLEIDNKIEMFQTNTAPGHMWSPGGRDYKVIWSGEFPLKISRDSLLKLQTSIIENNDVHTVFMPIRLNVRNRREIYARMNEPIEIPLKNGYYLYTLIMVDDEKRKLIKGSPKGKLIEFKDNVSRDTTNIIVLALMQSKLSNLTLKELIKSGNYNAITYRKYELTCEYDYYLQDTSDSHFSGVRGLRTDDTLRRYILPGKIRLDKNLVIAADYTDSIIVQLSKPDSTNIFLMTRIKGNEAEVVSTYLPDSIGIWKPRDYKRKWGNTNDIMDTTIECNIRIIKSYPNDEDLGYQYRVYDVLWENDYKLVVSRKERKKSEKRKKFLGLF